MNEITRRAALKAGVRRNFRRGCWGGQIAIWLAKWAVVQSIVSIVLAENPPHYALSHFRSRREMRRGEGPGIKKAPRQSLAREGATLRPAAG
jgi:hypothetical protein